MPTIDPFDELQAVFDPTVLARRLGVTLDPWQEEMMRAVVDGATAPGSTLRRYIAACGRRVGKSFVTALIVTWLLCYYRPAPNRGASILLVAPTLRQAQIIFRSVVGNLRALGNPVPLDVENRLSLETHAGARVVALGADSPHGIRGENSDCTVVDEAARLADDVIAEVLEPMLLTTNGRLILLGTPNGPYNEFADAWRDNDYLKWRVRADENPRATPDGIERARRGKSELTWRREYLAEFVDAESQAFSAEEIAAFLQHWAGDLNPWSLDAGVEAKPKQKALPTPPAPVALPPGPKKHHYGRCYFGPEETGTGVRKCVKCGSEPQGG